MKTFGIILVLLIGSISSCKNSPTLPKTTVFSVNQLKTQRYYIDSRFDTMLLTRSGCVLKIKANSFESDSINIKLEIKEALTNTDIVLGGLYTMSGKNALASGGMISINTTEGYTATIKKPFDVAVPTKNYNPNMQVFKGKEESKGKIDWIEPKSLPYDSNLALVKDGEALFKTNCANCHKVNNDATGPALAGLHLRTNKQWIYNFIKSPELSDDSYSMSLKKKWKNSGIMTAFPQLTKYDIDATLAYIKFQTNLPNSNFTFFESDTNKFAITSPCNDSCDLYRATKSSFVAEFESTEDKNSDDLYNLDRTIDIKTIKSDKEDANNLDSLSEGTQDPSLAKRVTPTSITATFYTIEIHSFGWHNIDIFLKDMSNCDSTEMFVNIDAAAENISVMLMIPSYKTMVEGGRLSDGKLFGFDELNGKILLPLNTPA